MTLTNLTPREIDAEIAEKVMGWERIGKGWHTKPEHRPSKDYPGRIINNWDSKGEHDYLVPPGERGSNASSRVAFCGCEGDLEIPPYSTDIAAAWTVVEHMRKHNVRGVLTLVTPTDDCKHYRAFFSKKWAEDLDKYPDDTGMADTASMAICLAALKVAGK